MKNKLTLLFAFICFCFSLGVYSATNAEIEKAALDSQAKLFKDTRSPVDGSGDLTLVFFLDYNCPYSRLLDKVIQEEVKTRNFKVVYMPLGIIDNASPYAAKAALAANKQGKFKILHDAFMAETNPLTEATIQAILARPAIASALDKTKYDADYKDMAVEAQMFENRILYEKLQFVGVPSVIAAKLDTNNVVVADKLMSFAGVDRNGLVYIIYKLRS